MMTMMSSTPPPMYIASSYVGFIRSTALRARTLPLAADGGGPSSDAPQAFRPYPGHGYGRLSLLLTIKPLRERTFV